jgi:hypothetical protein
MHAMLRAELVELRRALRTGLLNLRSEGLDRGRGDDENGEEEEGVLDHAGAADVRELLHCRSPWLFSMAGACAGAVGFFRVRRPSPVIVATECCITRNMPSTWIRLAANRVADEATKHGTCEKYPTKAHIRAWIT